MVTSNYNPSAQESEEVPHIQGQPNSEWNFFRKKLKSKTKAKTRRMEFTKIIASEQRTSNQ